jgi:hypothetical protein
MNFNELKEALKENYDINITKNDIKIPHISKYGVYDLIITVGNSLSTIMKIVVSGSIEDAKSLFKDTIKGEESDRK